MAAGMENIFMAGPRPTILVGLAKRIFGKFLPLPKPIKTNLNLRFKNLFARMNHKRLKTTNGTRLRSNVLSRWLSEKQFFMILDYRDCNGRNSCGELICLASGVSHFGG